MTSQAANMLSGIKLAILCLLTCAPWTLAITQVRHDSSFTPDYILRVSEKTVPIACRERFSAVVNGTSPGPPIHFKENQTTWVRVYNDMDTSNLTMHWHGLSQELAPFSDGSPMTSQWPIKAQHYFDYELHPVIGDAGTYFYHSQVGFQAITVAGTLIIDEYNDNPPYDYDEERTLFLSELFNQTDSQIEEGLLIRSNISWTGEAGAILLNGKGYRSLDAEEAGTNRPWSEPDPSVAQSCGPEVIEVEPDKTYRFRIIGGVSLSPLAMAFEGHENLTIIAADSSYTKPAQTNLIEIAAGQRYDILLHTKTEAELEEAGKSQFWIPMETRYRHQNNTFYGIISYNTNNDTGSSTEVPESPPGENPVDLPYALHEWMEYTLEPLVPNNFPSADEVTRQVFLTSVQRNSSQGQVMWVVNNETWTEDNQHRDDDPYYDVNDAAGSPYLVNIYQNGDKALPDYDVAIQNGGRDPSLNVYAAKVGEVIDIILQNEVSGLAGGFDAHPWHIHGGHVWDMGSGRGSYNAKDNEERLKSYSPIKRDTSLLYKYVEGDDTGTGHDKTIQGWRAWRLRVDNAGVWMVHCHILQHMILGMQAVFVMGNSSEITRGTSPDLVSGYLTYGGDAYGNMTYDPLVNHFGDP